MNDSAQHDCYQADCREAVSPWSHRTAYVTTALFAVPGVMGTWALIRKAPMRLPVFAGIWVAITTLVRKIVCCRCDYYGTECSTLMGRWTAMLFKKDEEHSLTPGAFYVDFALIGSSIVFPLPQVGKMGVRYLAFYILAVLVGALGVKRLACARCPVDVCFNNPRFRTVRTRRA